jgi:hypothetical protein
MRPMPWTISMKGVRVTCHSESEAREVYERYKNSGAVLRLGGLQVEPPDPRPWAYERRWLRTKHDDWIN